MKSRELDELSGIVAIGGGTGLGRLLSGLSFLGERLTGIVTTTDNGGSTGKLRDETGCIAWGDLRNCLGQLTSETDIKKMLFAYRFANAGSLSGHSLGNLMLLALDNMCVRPLDTINLFREFLNVKPYIYPMTETPAHLYACGDDGCDIYGEVNIDAQDEPPTRLQITPVVSAPCEAVEAIKNAELILLGPGSFFTSILPPLLVPEIRAAIAQSNAPIFFIANMAPEKGPAGKLGIANELRWIHNTVNKHAVDLVIWPNTRPLENNAPTHLHLGDMFNAQMPRMHDSAKLARVIGEAFRCMALSSQRSAISRRSV